MVNCSCSRESSWSQADAANLWHLVYQLLTQQCLCNCFPIPFWGQSKYKRRKENRKTDVFTSVFLFFGGNLPPPSVCRATKFPTTNRTTEKNDATTFKFDTEFLCHSCLPRNNWGNKFVVCHEHNLYQSRAIINFSSQNEEREREKKKRCYLNQIELSFNGHVVLAFFLFFA